MSAEKTINVSAKDYKQLKALKSRYQTLYWKIKHLEEKMDLPNPNEVQEKQKIIIADRRGRAIGKMSIFKRGKTIVPAHWRKRVT